MPLSVFVHNSGCAARDGLPAAVRLGGGRRGLGRPWQLPDGRDRRWRTPCAHETGTCATVDRVACQALAAKAAVNSCVIRKTPLAADRLSDSRARELTGGATPPTMDAKAMARLGIGMVKIGLAWAMTVVGAALTSLAPAAPARAEIESPPVVTARTRAALVADGNAVAPGVPIPIGLRLRLKPGWHTYWRNPGDSGEPVAVTLRLDGREINGPDVWPAPERIEIAGIVSYGHHGDVTLLTSVPVAATAKPGTTLSIEADAKWLVCEKVCVPEQGRFTLSLPVGDAAAASRKEGASPLSPVPLPSVAGRFEPGTPSWTLRLPLAQLGAGGGTVASAYFFPERGDLIDHSAPQTLHVAGGEITLGLPQASLPTQPPAELRGVLAITRQGADGARQMSHVQVTARAAAAGR